MIVNVFSTDTRVKTTEGVSIVGVALTLSFMARHRCAGLRRLRGTLKRISPTAFAGDHSAAERDAGTCQHLWNRVE